MQQYSFQIKAFQMNCVPILISKIKSIQLPYQGLSLDALYANSSSVCAQNTCSVYRNPCFTYFVREFNLILQGMVTAIRTVQHYCHTVGIITTSDQVSFNIP